MKRKNDGLQMVTTEKEQEEEEKEKEKKKEEKKEGRLVQGISSIPYQAHF